MLKIGSHTPFKAPGYLVGSAAFARKNQANAMMIYLGPPQNSRRVNVGKYNLEQYNSLNPKVPPGEIVVHAPYITNPASPLQKDFAVDFLVQEAARMNFIGCKYLVLHPGSYTRFDPQTGVKTLVNSLKTLLQKTQDVEILLENMSGKGTQIGASLEELSLVVKQVNNPRLGICFDTCHAWDSGLNIKDVEATVTKLRDLELLPLVKVLHVNDSKNAINSKKDRHANLGAGQIGLETLRQLVHHQAFRDAIHILETPWVNGQDIYKHEIKLLR